MPLDSDILREVWEGKVPVEFTLVEQEVTAIEQPKPYYCMVSRVSYFPLVMDKVSKYLSQFITEEDGDEIWLDYEGLPLKWHYPIGVLYDMFKTDEVLPWQITVHFKNLPESDLMHCGSREAVESSFMQTVKEADQLKHKAEIINGMQKRDHKQLWNGLVNDRFDQFWSVNRKLMNNSPEEPVRYLPIRIYETDKAFEQRLVKPLDDKEERITLEQFLGEKFLKEKMRFLSHGVDIPAETPVEWLVENFSYPDNFVHICILPSTE